MLLLSSLSVCLLCPLLFLTCMCSFLAFCSPLLLLLSSRSGLSDSLHHWVAVWPVFLLSPLLSSATAPPLSTCLADRPLWPWADIVRAPSRHQPLPSVACDSPSHPSHGVFHHNSQLFGWGFAWICLAWIALSGALYTAAVVPSLLSARSLELGRAYPPLCLELIGPRSL